MLFGHETIESYLKYKLDKDKAEIEKHYKQDNGQFLQRQLTAIEAQVIEYQPPNMSSRDLWHVNNEGSGLESIEYQELTRSGLAEFINDQTKELPSADFTMSSTPSPVRNLAIQYKWSYHDVQKAVQAKRPLQAQKALAAKEGTEQRLNLTAWFGDSKLGLKGFFSYIDKMNLVTPVNGVSGTKTWVTKTPAEIYDDIKKLIAAGDIGTNGIFESDVLALPVAQYRIVHDTHMSNDVTAPTIAGRILGTTSIKKIVKCPELKAVSAKVGAVSIIVKDVAIAFNSRKDVFTLQHAVEFTVLPIQIDLLNFVVPCVADTAGLFYCRENCASFLTDI